MDILGKAGSGIWRSARGAFYFGAGSRGAWRESHRARVYGRSGRGFLVRRAVQSWVRPSAALGGKRRRLDANKRLRCGGGTMRASGEQAAAFGNPKLQRVSRA